MTTTDIAFICFIVVEAVFIVLHFKFIYERPLLDGLCVFAMMGIFIIFMCLLNSFSL